MPDQALRNLQKLAVPGREKEFIEGPIWGMDLHYKGRIVLHGSCSKINTHIVSVVGHSGSGKSTVTAVLCQRGAQLVCDGMTPIDPSSLSVVAGPSRFKLDDESLQMLGRDPTQYNLVCEQSAKRYFPFADVDCSINATETVGANNSDRESFSSIRNSSSKLRLVLVVEDAEETDIVPITGAESLIKLIQNIYLGQYLPSEQAPIVMQRAAALIQNGVQVKALRRKKHPSKLIEIAQAIEREVSNLGPMPQR